MAHIIEQAKSGRAKCRKCKEKIAKDELRFGHEVANAFDAGEMTHQWYHLECAGTKAPLDLASALDEFDGDVPDREKLDEVIAANRKKQKPSSLPYAEAAPSARSKCQVCEEKIEKGEYRIAIEREIDTGGFAGSGAGYLHPACVSEYEDLPDDLEEAITANSTALDPAELQEIVKQLA